MRPPYVSRSQARYEWALVLTKLAHEHRWRVWLAPREEGYEVWVGDKGSWQSNLSLHSKPQPLPAATLSALCIRENLKLR